MVVSTLCNHFTVCGELSWLRAAHQDVGRCSTKEESQRMLDIVHLNQVLFYCIHGVEWEVDINQNKKNFEEINCECILSEFLEYEKNMLWFNP